MSSGLKGAIWTGSVGLGAEGFPMPGMKRPPLGFGLGGGLDGGEGLTVWTSSTHRVLSTYTVESRRVSILRKGTEDPFG